MGTLVGPGLHGGCHPGRLLGGGTGFISPGSGGRDGGDCGGCPSLCTFTSPLPPPTDAEAGLGAKSSLLLPLTFAFAH